MIRLLRTLSAGALVALVPCGASAATASLVRDIQVEDSSGQTGSSFQGVFSPILSLGGRALFPAVEGTSGHELWTSDGRTEGTSLVSDICPGNCSSQPFLLGRAGHTGIFLAASDEEAFRSSEIWRSDGTAAGTFPLVQGRELELCRNGFEGSAVLGGSLYFALSNHEAGCELWKSDGTVTGTAMVKDIQPGFGSDAYPADLVVFGGKLYFFASGPDGHPALWRSDGTEAGTAQAASLPYDPDFLGPAGLTVAGSRLFFTVSAGSGSGRRLWVSDGTAAGTRQIAGPLVDGERALQPLDSLVYFAADDGKGGQDLWRSDGTDAGTRQVTDFSNRYPIAEVAVAKAGGRLLLVASNFPADGFRLWVSGGTPATTVAFEGCAGGCPMLAEPRLATVNGRVLFVGSDAGHGSELWSTDGTGAGTKRLRDICPGTCSSIFSVELHQALGKWFFLAWNQGGGFGVWTTDGATVRFLGSLGPRPFEYDETFAPAEVGKKVLFTAAAGSRRRQLWESDGTPDGTRPVTLVGASDPGSHPQFLTALGPSGLLFVACDGQVRGVWRSGGTEETTAGIVSGAVPCTDAGSAQGLLTVGGLGYFLRGFAGANQLWRTDGTDAGTFALPPSGTAVSSNPVPFNGKVAFLVFDESGAAALWETDGTAAGTRKRLDLPDRARSLSVSGPYLYFIANTTSTTAGEQLWRTDGTAEGTRQVTFFDIGYHFDDDLQIVRLGNTTFFVGGGGLMATDGTPEGTAAVRAPDGKVISGVSNMVPFQGALYLFAVAHEEPFDPALWRTDGTTAGTALLARVAPRYDYRPDPAWSTVVGGQLFFSAIDGEHGIELWKTDGTPAGTVLVKDIFPGAGSSKPSYFTAAGGRLYFTANDGPHGFELWESDSTAAGTRMVQDLAPGGLSGQPQELTVAGGLLYFRADDSRHGPELWAYPFGGPQACQPSDERLCLGDGRFQVEADWRDFQGSSGQGHAVSLTGDTGYFWFFDAANVEVVLKVLDGRGLNGHHWAFYGALSNVEYSLTITDVQTGAVRRYVNPAGRLGSVGDTNAFGPKGATGAPSLGPAAATYEPIAAVRRSAAAAPCAPSSARLCLNNGRFAVEARWRDFQGKTGTGTAVPLSGGDTGYFWFFNAANVEVVLKVLDGRALNGKFWVFYGALSNVEYELTVTDTETGTVKTYRNPGGRLASVADTGAF